MNRIKKVLIITSIVLSVCLFSALGVYAFSQQAKASKAYLALENAYSANVQLSSSALRTIEADLSKLMVCTDKQKQEILLSSLAQTSSSCAQALSGLPIISTQVQDTLKFANQVSSYCKSVLANSPPDNFDEQIKQFFATCQSVNSHLAAAEDEIRTQDLSLLDLSGAQGIFASREQSLIEYPSVIFDGPFSDSQTESTPKREREEISIAFANEKLLRLGFELEFSGESGGDIPCYLFVSEQESALITKQGGILLSYVSSFESTQQTADENSLRALAEEFAAVLSDNARVVWQEAYGNAYVFNFAPVKDGVTLYPDLFKIKIAFDGTITGVETHGYYINNRERELDTPTISLNDAQSSLKEGFLVETSRLCLINLNQRELLCWEFFGKYNDLDYAIYVSATSGRQETEFRIISTQTGEMVV